MSNTNSGMETIAINLDSYDVATAKIKQLDAMLAAISGAGFVNFRNMNADLQENFIWALSEQAQDIRKAICGKDDNHA